MNSDQVQKIISNLSPSTELDFENESSLSNPPSGYRPNVISVEDAFFGDSGKGSIAAKFNNILNTDSNLLTVRFNGGANAGHETLIHGKLVVTHQVPTGIVCEGATALMTRCMVIHPEDLLTEYASLEAQFNGKLPGNLVIDQFATLTLDTHRALESALNDLTTGGHGSTGRGIATGYATHYLRVPVMVKDLVCDEWEDIFRNHYRLFDAIIAGFPNDRTLSSSIVSTMSDSFGSTRTVGDEDTFIKRLAEVRAKFKPFVITNAHEVLQNAWNDPSIPITFEGAQGPGLDPYHGVYPDVTASRPMSHNINDATYNIILPKDIYYRVAVLKATYMSSVGTRILPTTKDEQTEAWIQQAFDEKGRSTGRLRDIYPVSIPIANYLRKAAGYRFAVATHLDASKPDVNINIITHYTDKSTGAEQPYLPYQDHLNTLNAHIHTFNGWDGEAVKQANTFSDLPESTRQFLHFLSKTIAPLVMVTTGPDLDDYLKWNI